MKITIIRAAIASLVVLTAVAGASAQTDFSGEWTVVRSMDNTENPWVGDFVGLPLNADGLARAEGWDASLLSLPEYQCRPHGWAYIYRGPDAAADHEGSRSRSRARSSRISRSGTSPPTCRSISMVATVRPPEANHTWGGFSTATWEGDILRIKTTHLKEDYIRRNGAMVSDQATVTSFWIRRGDILTWINIVHDPVYLAEPLIRSSEYRLSVNSQVPAHPCTSAFEGLEKGNVPHYLPGENPFLKNLRVRYGLAPNAPTGGVPTMYPEYLKTLQPSEWTAGDRRAAPRRCRGAVDESVTHAAGCDRGGSGVPVVGGADRRSRSGEAAFDRHPGPAHSREHLSPQRRRRNIVASVGKDGVLLVDTGSAQMADKVLETVRALSRMVTASPDAAEVLRRRAAGMPVVGKLGAAADDGRSARATADHRHRQHQ